MGGVRDSPLHVASHLSTIVLIAMPMFALSFFFIYSKDYLVFNFGFNHHLSNCVSLDISMLLSS